MHGKCSALFLSAVTADHITTLASFSQESVHFNVVESGSTLSLIREYIVPFYSLLQHCSTFPWVLVFRGGPWSGRPIWPHLAQNQINKSSSSILLHVQLFSKRSLEQNWLLEWALERWFECSLCGLRCKCEGRLLCYLHSSWREHCAVHGGKQVRERGGLLDYFTLFWLIIQASPFCLWSLHTACHCVIRYAVIIDLIWKENAHQPSHH